MLANRLAAIARVLIAALALLVGAPAGRASAAEPVRFAETGHAVAGPFVTTFRALGGVDRLGYPRTEALVENGRLVQYFQRAVLEQFPEHAGTRYEVQLRLLGDELTRANRAGQHWRAIPANDAPAGARYYPETGHAIAGDFFASFDARGGLDSFGYPISEAYRDGGLLVQYFQRARFELHPGNPTEYRVLLGLLGDELIARDWRSDDPRLAAASAGSSFEWGSGRIVIAGGSEVGRYNAAIAVERLNGSIIAPGARLDFDDVAKSWDGRVDLVYKVSRGTSCEGGLVSMRGGGVCYVSTAIWRAWMQSGLKTVLRVSHSGLLDDFGAGFDAANTLVVENDSSATLTLTVRLDDDAIVATVFGDRPPDRQTTLRGPVRESGSDFRIYQDVRWLDGRTSTAAFRSHYCW
jgi:hypothetical protein